MAKFRCVYSGNVFVFESEHDIRDLRKHPDYEEVKEDSIQQLDKKPAGRPKKKLEETQDA